MSPETQKSDSASEFEENTRKEYLIQPSIPQFGDSRALPPGPSRERFNREPTTSSMATRSLTSRSLMTRSLTTRSRTTTETEYTADDLARISDNDLTELYTRYNDLYRETFANVSEDKKII